MTPIEQSAQQLQASLTRWQRVVVAFSGGVDSSVVAAAARAADLELAIAVTADSPSVPRWQVDLAKQIAAEIGIQHQIVETREGTRAEYRRNDTQRCFFCKQTLYEALNEIVARYSALSSPVVIVSGTNADDLGDYRPGIQAGRQASVVTPLADLGFGKSQVRMLAAHYGLSNHDLPASPCMASRIAYGVEVTPERLVRIERAEDWLRQQGWSEFRVRLHPGELARIEVPEDSIAALLQLDRDGRLTKEFKRLGFVFVTIDMEGFRSGSLNRVIVNIDTASPAMADKLKLPTKTTEVSS
jgi:pyridinium-3,5-biscarboxylic acid mononucleotide sulfurtransferase